MRRTLVTGSSVVVIGVIGSTSWLAFASLAGAIIAPGIVKVDLNRKPVQHLEGGIVKQVLVRDGQRVKAGEPLLVLGDVGVDSNLEMVRTQLLSERLKQKRLLTEQALQRVLVIDPKEIAGNHRLKELSTRELALFGNRRASFDSQIELLRQQAAAVRRETESLEAQIRADENALRTQRDELAQNQGLERSGFISKTRILGFERAVSEYDSRLNEHRSELARAHQKMIEIDLKSTSVRDSYVATASTELKQVSDRINELEEKLRASQDMSARQQIVAPVAGEVVDIKYTSPGSVIGPRETILEIVPVNPRLVVDIRVRPEDVSHVQNGAPVDIRFTSYPYRTTPLVRGRVIYVSADRLNERNSSSQPYFQALVEADMDSLKEVSQVQLMAGLPTEVYIRIKERSALTYLLDPILGYLHRAMREP